MDLSNPMLGNPGIGGTEYSIALTAYLLSQTTSISEVLLYVIQRTRLPESIGICEVENIYDAVLKARQQNIDLLILRPIEDEKLFLLIDYYKQKTITWSHNYFYANTARMIAECQYIVRNVFVGKRQYDHYIDHEIASKSTYIFNTTPEFSLCARNIGTHDVTFVGALTKSKGFHILAQQWENILRKVPDAKLNVIGTGQLYSQKQSMGKYGLAEQSYEECFMKYLTTNDGDIIESVRFWGILGHEKYDIYKNTSVGIINASGKNETFGLGIIEMGMLGVPTVTCQNVHNLDSVQNRMTGILCSRRNIYKEVIKLLSNQQMNTWMGLNAKAYINQNFANKKIIKQWIELFNDIEQGKPVEYYKPSDKFFTDLKFLRMANRRLKSIKMFSKLPSVIEYESLARKIFLGIKKAGK